jgi:hypothetical protein
MKSAADVIANVQRVLVLVIVPPFSTM